MLCRKHNTNSPYIVLISCLWFVCMGLSRIYAGFFIFIRPYDFYIFM